MNIFPAIDLKDNKCVRLSKGKDDTSVVFNKNPIDQAIYFEQQGCKRLHLVDIDAAFGRKNINSKTISEIRKAISIPIQLGGGIRTKEDAIRHFENKIDFLIIGSFSIHGTKEVLELANSYENKIYISLDVFKGNIMVKGWKEKTELTSKNIFHIYNKSKIKGYVFTDIENDGMLSGINIELIKENLKLTDKNIVVGGGLASYDDLKNLTSMSSKNLEAVIAGKSFYVGNIDLSKAMDILKNAQN